jgi:hypothetical protein
MTPFKPYIRQHFPGQIWKLVIDPRCKLLYAEVRDVENRQVMFSSFDLGTGSIRFIDHAQDEHWLLGIEGCFDGVLFLHGYQSAQSPVHKGITAINGFTGKVIWSNYNYTIKHFSVNGPVVYNTQLEPPRLFVLNAQNGAALWNFNPSVDVDIDPEISVPGVLEAMDDELETYITSDIKGNIHYIDYNSFRIVSLHTLSKRGLSQLLLIIQGGKLVYRDVLNDEIQKLQPEAFIMHGNRLIYIKNKTDLKVLNL